MPSINRIRVNNVKYNFGTQGYDDFSMRMYGRNTLYDLANGGGKSVLMLLLMQNLIPNCTLDDKQPIEKLFRDPSNTVIHSLIEWKLDECDIKDGFRFMTTGFAAKKAALSGEETDDGTAKIEYFNYCIFYRDYNKNDIINLPLDKKNEHISYKALRNYLHDLSRNDKNMMVYIFDRKGEYQRFIAGYGLLESHWEIVRGINKTEGHVRTYFETNYKTTRKVVEDLLIEEIIEKAYQTKTERESDKTESTVTLLMTIQDELRTLAEKKKDIQMYDHEKELIQLLIDRIESFMDLYKEQEDIASECASLYAAIRNEMASYEEKLEELRKSTGDAKEYIDSCLETLSVLKIVRELDELRKRENLINEIEGEIDDLSKELADKERKYKGKVAVSYYSELKKYQSELAGLSADRQKKLSGEIDIETVVAAIKKLTERQIAKLEQKLAPTIEKATEVEEEKKAALKEVAEGETEKAIAESRIEYISKDTDKLNREMAELQGRLITQTIGSSIERIGILQDKSAEVEDEIRHISEEIERVTETQKQCEETIREKESDLRVMREKQKSLESAVEEYRGIKDRFASICSIYMSSPVAEPDKVAEKIEEKITETVVNIYKLKEKLAEYEKARNDISEGRLIRPTDSLSMVREYITTRHGMDAMFGIDYVAALPEDDRLSILGRIPSLPYGIIVDDLAALVDDPGLMELDTDQEITLFDKAELGEITIPAGIGIENVRKSKEYFVDPKVKELKVGKLDLELKNLDEELKSKQRMLDTFYMDLDFVKDIMSRNLKDSEMNLDSLRIEIRRAEDQETEARDRIAACEKNTSELSEKRKQSETKLEDYISDITELNTMAGLEKKLSAFDRERIELRDQRRGLETRLNAAKSRISELEINEKELSAVYSSITNDIESLKSTWENKYSYYYVDSNNYPDLNADMAELERTFAELQEKDGSSRMALEREKLLRDTLTSNIERLKSEIEKLGVDIKQLESLDEAGELQPVNSGLLQAMKSETDALLGKKNRLLENADSVRTEKARLEGSTEYAKKRLAEEFGDASLQKADSLNVSDINAEIQTAEKTLQEKKTLYNKAVKELQEYENRGSSYEDVLQMLSRILDKTSIDPEMAVPADNIENVRDTFDRKLYRWDKISKDIERAKADMLKVKLRVCDSLTNMSVFELAASIRDDVSIPDTKDEAGSLLERLGEVVRIINLEQGRIEKSLTNMQQLRDNFIDECIERCLDVKSELDKLTRLSEITMDDQKIQMIRLSIPYVKDDLLKSRMSEYIDKLVEEVDKKDTDSERQKLLNMALSMKKLFSVIVTDMSKIKLLLYKRERIREQSRYLRYEEAVGSTGQSQGIYIQFLISIINYIAGMYTAYDGGSRSKTLFIDNPFGAAKDIYIWEPIFKLLEENKCQLIVPARGATPEITGRFDVNYVLGQQMTGKRTTTVVVDYSSKTKGEELEYKELSFEQATFDFI